MAAANAPSQYPLPGQQFVPGIANMGTVGGPVAGLLNIVSIIQTVVEQTDQYSSFDCYTGKLANHRLGWHTECPGKRLDEHGHDGSNEL